MFLTTVCYSKF